MYRFNRENFDNGWVSKTPDGPLKKVIATDLGGFAFRAIKIPVNVNVNQPRTIGSMKATGNLFDGVGCIDMNAPKTSEKLGSNAGLHLKGTGSSLEMTVNFKTTDATTVELWFRRPLESTVPPGTLTYLYTMSAKGEPEEAMSIYIDIDNKLKCAPFGRNNPDLIMVYEDAMPTLTDKWQYV